MAVLVYAEHQSGVFKKAAFEAVTFGYKVAQAMGTDCHALTIGDATGSGVLGQYGAAKVFNVNDASLQNFDSQLFASIISQVAEKNGCNTVLMMHSAVGKSLLGRLGVRMNAGTVPAANSMPSVEGGSFKIKRNVFSGKAVAEVEIKSENKVVSLAGNSFPPEVVAADVSVETCDVNIPAGRVQTLEVQRVKGDVPLPEAELVVSAGRGMKGPENWEIIEELARVLGAATACSRPVADTGWRPHHEHVGQTGVAIRPNLYIAAGISGAIQHLAGVNSSKVIVVINKDPEAPFFKAADYGIVADLFDVVPRLTAAIKKFKENQ